MTPRACRGWLRAATCGLFVIAAAAATGPHVAAGQNPFKKIFGDKDIAYKLYRDAAGRFEIEYPEKELRSLPSGGGSLAIFSKNEGPAFFVDHVRLKEPFTPGEVSQMPEMELERLRKQEPETKDFKSEMLDAKSGTGVLVRYSRIGKGREHAVHYTIAIGQDLFRLHGVVPEKLVAKFDPIFLHMLQSFRSPAEKPAAAPPKN